MITATTRVRFLFCVAALAILASPALAQPACHLGDPTYGSQFATATLNDVTNLADRKSDTPFGPPWFGNNDGSTQRTPVAKGELLSTLGHMLSPNDGTVEVANGLTVWPTQLNRVEILANLTPTPEFYAGLRRDVPSGLAMIDSEVIHQLPFDISGSVTLQARQTLPDGSACVGNTIVLPVVESMMTLISDSNGVIMQDRLGNRLNGISGGFTVYGVGLGALVEAVKAGVSATRPIAVTNPVSVSIDGVAARVTYAGITPGIIGIYQVNIEPPQGLGNGPHKVMLTQAGRTVEFTTKQ